MTDRSRIRFYLPAWTRAWRRIREITFLPEPVTGPDRLLRQVLDVANRMAAPGKPDAIRHACHVVALGRDVSSKSMTAAQADRVVLLFRLLADPDDLASMQQWDQPTHPDRRRLLWKIRRSGHAPEYVAAIARDKFGGRLPDELEPGELRDLLRTLVARARSQATQEYAHA